MTVPPFGTLYHWPSNQDNTPIHGPITADRPPHLDGSHPAILRRRAFSADLYRFWNTGVNGAAGRCDGPGGNGSVAVSRIYSGPPPSGAALGTVDQRPHHRLRWLLRHR